MRPRTEEGNEIMKVKMDYLVACGMMVTLVTSFAAYRFTQLAVIPEAGW